MMFGRRLLGRNLLGFGLNPWGGYYGFEDAVSKVQNQIAERMSEAQKEINRVFSSIDKPSCGQIPAVNVWTKDDGAYLTCQIPGVTPEDMEISVTGKTLTLKGSRKVETNEEQQSYHRAERWTGNFVRTLSLPFDIDANKVDASFLKGTLNVTLPMAEAEKPRKIEIKAQ
ncbi:Hsp20/alpha crystallin family protein [Candidatus Magnetomonas plexicatena]|uniref:Hsp20/alpha crystallin family protein n=1 Tax=Candidatus Magnetomonas plexicatena TaxID=2552947 RepID=UPI001C74B17F|nr:Hsp20/alpha crystallin family protein [Nitrospirales bacterium LBB_01]